MGWFVWFLAVAGTLGIVPTVIAFVRRHHNRVPISVLNLAPPLLAVLTWAAFILEVGGRGAIGVAIPVTLIVTTFAFYVSPVTWLLSLVWSLTSIRPQVVYVEPEAAPAPSPAPEKRVWQMSPEERLAERRRRGY